jgi:hypothetical protein
MDTFDRWLCVSENGTSRFRHDSPAPVYCAWVFEGVFPVREHHGPDCGIYRLTKLGDSLEGRRDGETITDEDLVPLNRQMRDVYDWTGAPEDEHTLRTWWTLEQLSEITGHPQASVSARLRDFRKTKYGGHTVTARKRDGTRQREYQLVWNEKVERP